jgi:hypothetical protein
MKVGYELPGDKTIPDQISRNKNPYYEALEKADRAFAKDAIDLTNLERLIAAALAAQLADVHQKAVRNDKTS